MSYYYGYYGYGADDAAEEDAPVDTFYEEPAVEMEEEDDDDGASMMSILIFGLVAGADAYRFTSVSTAWGTTYNTMVAANNWDDSDWGKYETQAMISAGWKGAIALLSFVLAPVGNLMMVWGVLSAADEAYNYSLLSTAKDGTMGDTGDSMSGTNAGLIAGAAVFSLLAAMPSGGDDEEEDEYYEEAAPAEEPAEEDSGDSGYYGYYY